MQEKEYSYKKTNKIKTLWQLLYLGFLVTKYAFKGSRIYKKQGARAYISNIKAWGMETINTVGIKLIVEGRENVKSGESYVYIANHTSLLDIPILIEAIPDYIHFMYKYELEKVPILGYGLRNSPFIPIKRENPKDAMSSINEAAEAINKTGSVVLFPEGTRSTTGEVGIFKRGAFVLASKTKKKIIPIAIIGVDKILPPKKFNINSGNVKVIIYPPVAEIPENRLEMKKILIELNNKIANSVKYEREKM